MKLRVFTILIATAVVSVGLFAASALIIATDRLERTASLIQAAVQSIYAVEELRALLMNYNRETFLSQLREEEPPAIPDSEKEKWFSEIVKYSTTTAELDLVGEARKHVSEYFKRISSQNHEDPALLYVSVAPYLNHALASLDQLVELNRSQAEELGLIAVEESRWADTVGGVIMALIVALLAGVLFLARRLIFLPLLELKDAIEGFRQGMTPRPCENSYILEFRKIGAAFGDMSSRLARHRQLQLSFIAGVVHDIRNPLNALQSALRLLRGPQLDDEKRQEVFSVASKQVAHLATLTKDLADTASIESGHLSLRTGSHDVARLVKDAVGFFADSTELHQFILEIPNEAYAHCDPDRITQVVNNLIGNAVKYSPRGGIVKVSLEAGEDLLTIAVADHGIGIAPEDEAGIFEPFRRTATTERAFHGMGLGLSVVKRIVEAHGGHIEVQSAVGEGSLFRVRIPRGVISPEQREERIVH